MDCWSRHCSIAIAAIRGLKLDKERVNVNGGAVSLGHPIGASGARILATLLYAMEDRGEKLGIAKVLIAQSAGVGSAVLNAFRQVGGSIGIALMGAIIWNLVTWWFGLPSSSSHALIGGLCGAVAFTYAQPWLDKALIGTAPKVIFTDLLGIPYWQGALGLAAAIVVVLFVMEKLRSWRADLGSDVDGVTSASPAPPAPGSAAGLSWC